MPTGSTTAPAPGSVSAPLTGTAPGNVDIAPGTNPSSSVVTSNYAANTTANNQAFFNGINSNISATNPTPGSMAFDIANGLPPGTSANPANGYLPGYTPSQTTTTGAVTNSAGYTIPGTGTSTTTSSTPPVSTTPKNNTSPNSGVTTSGTNTSTTNTNQNVNGVNVPSVPDLQNAQIDPTTQSYINQLTSLKATADASSQSLIAAIGNAFDQQIAQQGILNNMTLSGTTTSGIVNGLSEYAPSVAASEFQSQVAANMRSIADLESKKYQAIAQAQLAQQNQDFTQLDTIRKDYTDAQDQQRTLLQNTYDNVIKQNQDIIDQQTNNRQQKAADLDYATKTAQNFAPSILQQLSALPDQASKDAFVQQFATTHNIDPATLSGVVQQYSDTINQSMKTAMYSMLSDNPRAGITMSDINGNNIESIAAKVAQGPDFQLKTASEQADIQDKLAQAAISQAQVNMMRDPNTITSLATATLNNGGTVPASTPSYMIPVVLSAARQMAPSVLPSGAIVGTDGMPKNLPETSQTQVQAGMQMYKALQDMQQLQSKIATFPGADTIYAAGELVGATPTQVTQFENDSKIISQNYDVLKGGVRGGSSASLLQTAAQYVPQIGQLSKYNQQDANTLQQAVVEGLRDVLNTNGVQLNNFPILTPDESTALKASITAQGKTAGYTDDQIKQSLSQYGIQ